MVTVAVVGGVTFAASLLYFAVRYAVGFDAPPHTDRILIPAVCDIAIFTVFALHHSIFARTKLKAVVTRLVPATLERSVYVWIASLLFLEVCAVWVPVPGVLWQAPDGVALALRAIQLIGVAFTIVAAKSLDVLALAGIRQVLPQTSDRVVTLDDRGPYGFVRHPIYFAWLLMVWAAPVMNGTRLVFAAISTFYLVVAIPFEERDLHRSFGEAYARYASKVRYRMLPGVY